MTHETSIETNLDKLEKTTHFHVEFVNEIKTEKRDLSCCDVFGVGIAIRKPHSDSVVSPIVLLVCCISLICIQQRREKKIRRKKAKTKLKEIKIHVLY